LAKVEEWGGIESFETSLVTRLKVTILLFSLEFQRIQMIITEESIILETISPSLKRQKQFGN
jgi:hypothetical protein